MAEREPYVWDAEAFHREMDLAMNIAAGVHDAVAAPAVKRQQGGVDILVGRCPLCGVLFAISGPGKHLCRGTCGRWLQVEKAG